MGNPRFGFGIPAVSSHTNQLSELLQNVGVVGQRIPCIIKLIPIIQFFICQDCAENQFLIFDVEGMGASRDVCRNEDCSERRSFLISLSCDHQIDEALFGLQVLDAFQVLEGSTGLICFSIFNQVSDFAQHRARHTIA